MKIRTNQEWITDLISSGAAQTQALEDLRLILVQGALYTFSYTLVNRNTHSRQEILELAYDCAQDALLAILANLSTFRGESRFTTWAYKFAIHFALTTARREYWKGFSIDTFQEESDAYEGLFQDQAFHFNPERLSMQTEIWKVIHQVIHSELTFRQRLVLKLIVFDQVPMEVVVEHLDTNRNAVYKLLHDSRLKIKARLLSEGYRVQETIDLFSENY